MERSYWLRRMRAAMNMARHAATAETRLIHFDMAGLYSIKAAGSRRPFLLAQQGPATIGEREALRLTGRQDREPGSSFWIPPRRPARRGPDGPTGGSR